MYFAPASFLVVALLHQGAAWGFQQHDDFQAAVEYARSLPDDGHRESKIETALTQEDCRIITRQTTGKGSIDIGYGEAEAPPSLWGGMVFAECPEAPRVVFQAVRRGVIDAPTPNGSVGVAYGQWPIGMADGAYSPTSYGRPSEDHIRRVWTANEGEAYMIVVYGTDSASPLIQRLFEAVSRN